MTARRRTAVAVLAVALALAGCSQTPFADDSFRDRIPEALRSADLGVTDAFAEKGVDGLTTDVFVGATFERPELTVDEVAEFVTVIVEHNTVPVTNLVLAPEDSSGAEINIVPQPEQLGADPVEGTFVQITLQEAETIAQEHR